MEKSGRPIIVSRNVVLCVVEPLVPVTVMLTGAEGTGALAAAVNVSVLTPLPPVTLAGLKVAVTPVGKPVALRATLPVKPLTGKTNTDVLAVAACSTLVPLAETLKDGAVVAGTGGKAFCTFWVNSAAKNCPAGGELAIEPVNVFPARGLVWAGSQLGSA